MFNFSKTALKEQSFMKSLALGLIFLICFSAISFAEEVDITEDNAVEKSSGVLVDISEYTESKLYHVEKIIPTEFGTVLYFWPVGAPHGGISPNLTLIKEDGSKINLSEPVSRADLFHHPQHENIVLSEDGKTLTFSVSFDERSEVSVADGEIIVLHDAGTYYYKADLEAGVCIETGFEPLNIISEYDVSAWAKTEVEKAIELGFVPLSMREKCKQNITREEFCELIYNLIFNFSRTELPQVSSSAPLGDTHNDKIISLWWWEIIKGKGTFTQEPVISPEGVVKTYPTLTVIAPNDLLTREEAAVIIIRMVNKFFSMPATEMWFEYRDADEISDWASGSIQTISNLGFMKGVGENIFAPKDTYTTEQAVATLVRVYERAEVVAMQ